MDSGVSVAVEAVFMPPFDIGPGVRGVRSVIDLAWPLTVNFIGVGGMATFGNVFFFAGVEGNDGKEGGGILGTGGILGRAECGLGGNPSTGVAGPCARWLGSTVTVTLAVFGIGASE